MAVGSQQVSSLLAAATSFRTPVDDAGSPLWPWGRVSCWRPLSLHYAVVLLVRARVHPPPRFRRWLLPLVLWVVRVTGRTTALASSPTAVGNRGTPRCHVGGHGCGAVRGRDSRALTLAVHRSCRLGIRPPSAGCARSFAGSSEILSIRNSVPLAGVHFICPRPSSPVPQPHERLLVEEARSGCRKRRGRAHSGSFHSSQSAWRSVARLERQGRPVPRGHRRRVGRPVRLEPRSGLRGDDAECDESGPGASAATATLNRGYLMTSGRMTPSSAFGDEHRTAARTT